MNSVEQFQLRFSEGTSLTHDFSINLSLPSIIILQLIVRSFDLRSQDLPQIYSESLSEVVKTILVKNPDDRPS